MALCEHLLNTRPHHSCKQPTREYVRQERKRRDKQCRHTYKSSVAHMYETHIHVCGGPLAESPGCSLHLLSSRLHTRTRHYAASSTGMVQVQHCHLRRRRCSRCAHRQEHKSSEGCRKQEPRIAMTASVRHRPVVALAAPQIPVLTYTHPPKQTPCSRCIR